LRDLGREILGENGPIAKFLGGGYEPRQEQLAMAKAVSQTLAAKGVLVAEAGTGVGKSYAYLVPAILRCIANGERVVVATHTINLQEQLLRKDIPLLQDTLGDGAAWGLDPKNTVALSPVLVKGRGNYISRRRLKLAGDRSDRLFDYGAEQRSLKTIQEWVETTEDGTLSTLPQLERYGVWDRVQSDTDNCMGRKCPTYQSCFYQKARREMEKGNLLVCNHAVFFADLKLRGQGDMTGFLPPYQHVILDEAHTLEDVASDHFGLTLTESRVERYLTTLYNPNTQRGYLSGKGFAVAATSEGGGALELLDKCVQGVLGAQGESRAFFEALLRLARSGTLRNGRIAAPELLEPPDRLVVSLKTLSARLRVLRDSIKGEEDRFELNAYAVRADAIAFDADVLGGQKQQGCVYWVEGAGADGGDGGEWGSAGRGGQRRPTARLKLACSPIEVGPILRERFFNQKLGVVLTSATLATTAGNPGGKVRRPVVVETERRVEPVDGEPAPTAPATAKAATDPFAHCRQRLGVDAATTLQLGSPFDYRTQARVIVDTSVPDARGSGDAYGRYLDVLCDRLMHHVDATDGGAFVLFTSFAVLNACADRLAPRLALRAYPLLVQGRDGPPARILETFRQSERSVLFGAASFWQGVDVRGDTLRNVIITKLPFDPPDRPLVEARCDLIKARGGDPFKEESLPRALLRFRQGFGRLIRSRTDTGQVVILDGRVVNTGYGRLFLKALPEGVPVETLRPPRHQPAADDSTAK
jgi:ATP-dependent DNA helicase DinG